MRKLVFILALIGLFYVASSTYACYRRVFPPAAEDGAVSYETMEAAPGITDADPVDAAPIPERLIFAGEYDDDIRRFCAVFCMPGLLALTVMTMYAAQRAAKQRPKHPTLFALDEFPHLGMLEIVETAAGGFRKYGIKLLTIAQTINQLKHVYPATWSDFLGAAECVIWMSNGDQPTREHLSNILGSATQDAKVSGGILSTLRAHLRREDRKLMSPGQLKEYLKTNIIVTRADERPLRLKAEPYFRALPVTWYEADHFYGETPARALTRRVLTFLKGRRSSPPSPSSPHMRQYKEKTL